MKGWEMSPVHRSDIANPPRRIWNGVLTKVFFQIAAKMSAFPTTATGEEKAINKAVARVTALEYDALVWLSTAQLQVKKNVFSGEEPLLDMSRLVKMDKIHHRHGNIIK